ncbi:hypothetical protein GQ43DRAFT_452281 [Delitschia confertaspora ATCC 74209]|uniref:Uncharacterized protein n=1 Tax=Delitschia confertaspora ATCC 74209 TaxID=1513339 RepID=A0A9P4MN19_9PLEO|nr:hypothetical protein GQ43DRAFT_452281 [Delitschia confertaspora ATCC 74209]
MFSADLSWGDPDVEKVGARRERKAKEKEKERSTPASTPKKGPPSTKSSIFSTDRETWWPLNLRKAKSKIVKPNKHAQLDSVPDLTASRTVSSSGSKPFGLNLPVDPKLHPEWTFSSTFRSTLPSGAPLDSPGCEPPDLHNKLPSLPGEVSGNDSPNIQFSRFSQFIRQMESVGPKMLIERLKGEWQGSDDVVDEEWKLEKQLWLLTAFQLHSYRTSGVPRPISPSLYTKGKILELYGHILRECHRLLEPGGMLEIRIMDASPVRRTAGPKMRSWVEDRVSLNLERLFRCSKPCLLVPNWVSDAGFELRGRFPSARGHMMQMPCAVANDGCHPDDELPMLVGRALWKDIWGSFVSDEPGETRWWWEDDAVIQECLEHQTVFECGALYAYKR